MLYGGIRFSFASGTGFGGATEDALVPVPVPVPALDVPLAPYGDGAVLAFRSVGTEGALVVTTGDVGAVEFGSGMRPGGRTGMRASLLVPCCSVSATPASSLATESIPESPAMDSPSYSDGNDGNSDPEWES